MWWSAGTACSAPLGDRSRPAAATTGTSERSSCPEDQRLEAGAAPRVHYDGAVVWKTLGQSFVTLLVILDPLGNIPIFVTLTRNEEPRTRNRAAYVSVAAAGAILAVFAVFGD